MAGQRDPLAAGEGGAEREGANEADERIAGAAEGRGADVGRRLPESAGEGARSAGGGERLDEQG